MLQHSPEYTLANVGIGTATTGENTEKPAKPTSAWWRQAAELAADGDYDTEIGSCSATSNTYIIPTWSVVMGKPHAIEALSILTTSASYAGQNSLKYEIQGGPKKVSHYISL